VAGTWVAGAVVGAGAPQADSANAAISTRLVRTNSFRNIGFLLLCEILIGLNFLYLVK
jgi:hypothetical protein